MARDPKFDAPEFPIAPQFRLADVLAPKDRGAPARPHCGRLDRHAPHEWLAHGAHLWQRTVQSCPGVVTIEGGAECVTCQQSIANCEHSWRGQMRRWSE